MDKMALFHGLRKKDMIARTFHLDAEQLPPLRKLSEQMGISQSEVVRRSISFFIDGYQRAARKQAKKSPNDS